MATIVINIYSFNSLYLINTRMILTILILAYLILIVLVGMAFDYPENPFGLRLIHKELIEVSQLFVYLSKVFFFPITIIILIIKVIRK